MIKDLKIMDWLNHGGHQYEFFKTGPQFFCTKLGGEPPKEGDFGRPIFTNPMVNMTPVKEAAFNRKEFDIIMVRTGLNQKRFIPFQTKKKTPGIAVIQTATPGPIPKWAKVVVWNSKYSMDKNYKQMAGKKHFYIPHGFDPEEFRPMDIGKNGRILTVASVFERRGRLLGFDDWKHVSDKTGLCDLAGHGDEGLSESIGTFSVPKLVEVYNKYNVFLNTTIKSAMPRSRAEALMCGLPVVTTNNHGINLYLKNELNCLFADNRSDMEKAVKRVLSDKELADSLSHYGRQAAMKHFNINKYRERWHEAFREALGA